ncbi:MAG: CapA family protein [Spirochaetes bacterium]|nr:CapA family protein [Spirochaetota bacterium]
MKRRAIKLYIIPALSAITLFFVIPSSEDILQRFSILFVGDILLANEAEEHIHAQGIDYPFKKIKNDLLRYDYVIGNMEAPITSRGLPYTDKAYTFRVHPSSARCLRDLKLDAVSLSNNHLMDYGKEGMEDTIAYLNHLNIRHAGGGKNVIDARRPVLLRRGDVTICMLSYCDRPPNDYYASSVRPGIARLSLDDIKEDIAIWKQTYTIVIISLHWGIEQTHDPQPYQKALAREIINAGADAIIGHHPHWPQAIEMYRGRPVVYSLGNFINGFTNHIERDNIAVAFYYTGNSLERIKIIPVAGKNRAIKCQPYIQEGSEAKATLRLVQSLSKKYNTDFDITANHGLIDLTRIDTQIVKTEERPAQSDAE